MYTTTKAIVLSKLRYRDHDLIVKCFTQEHGVVSYLLRGVYKTKKGFTKIAYFQLLSQLQLVTDYKPNRSLQYIKDIKINHFYTSLHTHITKSAIVMFLAEILSHALQEEEQNDTLFHYLEATLQWLDVNERSGNFHLLFLMNLSKHLGFYPDTSQLNKPYFNLKTGSFQLENQNNNCISGENLTVLKSLLGTTFDALEELQICAKQRREFLNVILLYFQLHLGNFKPPKSLQVFNEVFND